MTDKFWQERGMDCGILDVSSEYTTMSDHETEALAKRIVEREVFGSWQVRDTAPLSVEQVFVFMMALDDITLKRVRRDDAVYLYEYISEAEPQRVNGYPIFFSGNWLDSNDFNLVMTRVRELEG